MTRKIRIGKSRDIPIIADYNIAMAMETEGKTLDKEIITAGVNSIINDNSKGVYWVVEIEEELVGQLMITYEWSDWRNGTMWWIQSVYVSEDFRRQGIYTSLYENLIKEEESYYMVGYTLENTLSENGGVNRGICSFNSDNYLENIKEEIGISNFSTHEKDTIVSMNMWGFQSNFISHLNEELELFLKENINNESKEFFIPMVVNKLIKGGKEKVKVLQSNEKWIGMSYKEDKLSVELSLENKNYPKNLWRKY